MKIIEMINGTSRSGILEKKSSLHENFFCYIPEIIIKSIKTIFLNVL